MQKAELPELKGVATNSLPPADANVFEVYYDSEKKMWNLWKSKASNFKIPKEIEFH
jgi:hypothetical protein